MFDSHTSVTLDLSEREFLRLSEALRETKERRMESGRLEEAAMLKNIREKLIGRVEFSPYRTVPRGSQ